MQKRIHLILGIELITVAIFFIRTDRIFANCCGGIVSRKLFVRGGANSE